MPLLHLRQTSFRLILAAWALLGLSACSDNPVEPPVVEFISTSDIEAGTGAAAEAGDTVLFNYVGSFPENGNIFESSYETGIPLDVIAGTVGTSNEGQLIFNNVNTGSVITGLSQGLVGTRVGMLRRVDIPQSLAYGGCGGFRDTRPNSVRERIPPCAQLRFEVRILRIRP